MCDKGASACWRPFPSEGFALISGPTVSLDDPNAMRNA
jgi:hypothetical protein